MVRQVVIDVSKLIALQARRESADLSDFVLPSRFLEEQTTHFKDGINKIGESTVIDVR